jgi:hypothetical protein
MADETVVIVAVPGVATGTSSTAANEDWVLPASNSGDSSSKGSPPSPPPTPQRVVAAGKDVSVTEDIVMDIGTTPRCPIALLCCVIFLGLCVIGAIVVACIYAPGMGAMLVVFVCVALACWWCRRRSNSCGESFCNDDDDDY